MKKTIIVIFRKYKSGEILALFPYEQHSTAFCSSYMHIGQHSGADYKHCISTTIPAKEWEYADLLKDLKGIYVDYTIKIRKRATI